MAGLETKNVDATEWKQFADRVNVTDLYYELASK